MIKIFKAFKFQAAKSKSTKRPIQFEIKLLFKSFFLPKPRKGPNYANAQLT